MPPILRKMKAGEVVAGRFHIERLAGSGGMGKVFLARDGAGGPVAIKVLHESQDVARFHREAQVLAGLHHPGIVRYVDQGTTDAGEAYLITEWLEGETLAERLARAKLSVEESLTVGQRAGEALGAAHRQGVVHRDVKPSNLFLVGGGLADLKVLDFGIARAQGRERSLTMTGAMLGTLGYIAPEQARGDRSMDARVDVFSLGCVLFKCLTGRAAFVGEDALAVLLKLVMEDAPRLQDFLAGAPPALDALLAQMLAKDRDERPRDGAAVAAALAAVEAGGPRRSSFPAPALPRRDLASGERRVMALVVAQGRPEADRDETTVAMGERRSQEHAVLAAQDRWRARRDRLEDGSMVLTLTSAEAATDLAAQAARCALSLRPHVDGPVSVVLGWGEVAPRAPTPVGELIDRAVALLSRTPPTVVRVDAVLAGLLDSAFEVEPDEAGLVLLGERDGSDSAPRLLHRTSPFVGRERELGLLEATYRECVEDSVARVVLVLGEPGMGKSRVRQEMLRRLRQHSSELLPWIGRGAPMSRGSAFCLLAQALRGGLGVADGEPLAQRRRMLKAGVARHVPRAEVGRTTELLGELVDVRVPDAEASDELRAARRDPLALGDQMWRALEAFLAAETAVHPVVIILEDLHWGDLPTVTYIGAALRALADRPLFVLALARPEVHALFPRLWADAEVQEIRLSKLTRRAGERLVRHALGEGHSAEAIAAIVERADGNAFYLEELIRAQAEGRGDGLPETVLAMVQSRLEAMESGARRVLRAASVFGRSFWRGGLAALVGESLADGWLGALADREVIAPAHETRFPGDVQYAFRHAIVQEAAHAMLTEDDRAMAHRLAAEWLEAAGETDALIMAEHLERGGEAARAAACCARAAAQALRGNDLDAAIDLGQRGLRLGSAGQSLPGEVRAALETPLLEAYAWRNDWAATLFHADNLFHREPPGTLPWCMAALGKVWAAPILDRFDSLLEAVLALREVEPAEGARPVLVQALGAAVTTLLIAGSSETAGAYLARMEQIGAPMEAADPFTRGWMEQARGTWCRQNDGDPHGSLVRMRAAAAAFAAGHNPQQAMFSDVHAAIDAWHLGAWEEAHLAVAPAMREPSSTRGLRRQVDPDARPAAETGLRLVTVLGAYVVAMVQADEGLLDEANASAQRAIGAARAHHNRYFEGIARTGLGIILRRAGDLAAAAAEANAAAELLSGCPADRAMALAVLSAVRLDEGRPVQALGLAREAREAISSAPGYVRALIRLAWAEALAATGAPDARTALDEACSEILARASAIAEPSLRASFLAKVPQNARTLALGGR